MLRKTADVVKEFGANEKDTGSPVAQIAILTNRIVHLTDHLRTNKYDHSTRRGLLTLVSTRRKLIKYLQKHNHEAYIKITDALGIRRAK